MNINLVADSSVASAPAGFVAAVQAAAAIFEQDFPGNYTVNIRYGWNTYNNKADDALTANPNESFGGAVNGVDNVSYATVKALLTNNASLADQQAAVSSLPASDASLPGAADDFFVSSAQQKALGVYAGSTSTIDGAIGFGTQTSDWLGLALTEIAHALGWTTEYYASEPTIADLFRFSSAGVRDWTFGQNEYFSLNDGATNLASFATSFDTTLFTGPADDALHAPITSQTTNLSALDIEALNADGFGGTGASGGGFGALVDGYGPLTSTTPQAVFFSDGDGASSDDTITLGAPGQTVYLNQPLAPYFGDFDVVQGFKSGIDRLAVDIGEYGVTPGGYQFVSGPGAKPTTAQPTFYFDTTTSYLWFDAGGDASTNADLVAFLPGLASLSATDLTLAQVSFTTGASLVNKTPGTTSYGEGQNQTLWATGVNETLVGGPYREQLLAQAKNDVVFAGNVGAFVAGLGGDDQLFGGGAGADAFYFNSPKAGVDTIYNFSEAQGDNITIQGSAFSAASGFKFTAGVGFIAGAGATAVAATATLAYDTSTGYLWFDPDGTGPATRTLLAFLPGVPTLHAADFTVA